VRTSEFATLITANVASSGRPISLEKNFRNLNWWFFGFAQKDPYILGVVINH
jgi:3-hydroxymyristoyl/3-hydroxydecanoyl-(acyl carrier protein) dehydratase